MVAGPEETKNQRGNSPPPDSDPFSDAEFSENLTCWSIGPWSIRHRPTRLRLSARTIPSMNLTVNANRQFKFHERSQLFIRPHNETLSVAVIRVSNPRFSAARRGLYFLARDDLSNGGVTISRLLAVQAAVTGGL